MSIDWNNKDDIVRVRVNGHDYESTVEAFTPIKDIVNAAPIYDQATGRRLIQGAGQNFMYIINYLESDQTARTLYLPTNFTEHAYLKEVARRFGLKDMVTLIDHGKFPNHYFI